MPHLATPDQAAPPGAPGALRGWSARRVADLVLAPSPAVMRRIALAGVAASAAIILTGAAVRLSQSGLGCPDWPQCTARSLVASGDTGDSLIHRWVEFGNRLVTVVLTIAVGLSLLGNVLRRPRRSDLAPGCGPG